MKKTISIVLLALILVVCVVGLTGCGEGKDKEAINNTKSKIEEILSEIKNSGSSKQFIEASWLSRGRDLMIELEELDEKGEASVYVSTDSDIEQIPEEIRNNDEIFYVFVASSKQPEMWTYVTLDIETGNITWHDNY